ncbi:TatD family hydrolase [Secundilactobacillus collinoides]|uniref:TatD family magnesium (Mg2+)-dependent deoxyribonuclease n=2 Tax=Secundilactobacillus collinoides TaxID=33960 RepID=A0A0R2B8X8_SECCO|nr:TatD family hydrolase [Secundilactobacillus collinoides]KRM75806.1 TatD family magnesium (Mg2+)-dependent deoxyribonuclease [Secundilactobacillus collinoides DSM 20515 = JCM 1123]KZL39410.1 hypothetical protein TY91_10470 [Secundilactobacillus collinoides]
MIDAHCHAEHQATFIQFQQLHHIQSILNCDSPEELAFNRQHAGPGQVLSCGIHPWHADQELADAALNQFLTAAPVIGEIGLDSVWTKLPLAVQRPVFLTQLAMANTLHKPVIIHTKGCEAEILNIIQEYPKLHILIHWYSSEAFQADYLKLPNVYFSIGPDLNSDAAVARLSRTVPLDRVLVESDGLGSIAWARKKDHVNLADYAITLQAMYAELAAVHHMPEKTFETAVTQNLAAFIAGS